jgi:hypothetical protein
MRLFSKLRYPNPIRLIRMTRLLIASVGRWNLGQVVVGDLVQPVLIVRSEPNDEEGSPGAIPCSGTSSEYAHNHQPPGFGS